MAREVASASAEGGRVSAGDLGERLLDNHVDNAAVFRVHADEAIVLCCLAHGLEDRGVIEHEDARVSHEELEAGDAFADELAHFLELRGAEIGNDAVESVVGDGLVVGFFHPGIESLAERLTFVLDGEVNQRGGAAKGGGDGAGLEIVGAGGAAEGHVEVRVDVNATGDHEAASGVEDTAGIFGWKLGGDGGDFVAGDANVGEERVRCGHDCAVADYRVKTHLRSSGILSNLHRTGPPTPLFFVSADSKGLSIPVSPLE